MNDRTVLNPIMDKIIKCFKERYSDYTIVDYDNVHDDEGIKTPAILLQMASFEIAPNPIKELFRTRHTFRAYICESYRGKAERRVRDVALDVAKFIDGNDWSAKDVFDNARFEYAAEDEFNEKISSCEVWYCEWEQDIFSNKDSR